MWNQNLVLGKEFVYMAITEQFLEQYKSFETVLRGILGPDMTVLRYEDQSSNPEKLRMCRLVRNFLQHTPDAAGFIVPTDEMRRFLKQEAVRVAAQAEKAKDLSYRPAPIKLTHTWQYAFRLFTKSGADWLPVVDDKSQLIGVLTMDTLFAALGSGKDITANLVQNCYPAKGWKKTLDDFVVCNCEDILPCIPLDKVILVRGGKYSGVIDLR